MRLLTCAALIAGVASAGVLAAEPDTSGTDDATSKRHETPKRDDTGAIVNAMVRTSGDAPPPGRTAQQRKDRKQYYLGPRGTEF